MKTINVVCAILQKDQKIFACQRGYGEYKGGWEFPGGKVEMNESPEDAIKREILEELDVEIAIDEYIYTIEYDYPKFHLSMKCYLCHIINGELLLKEASDAKWLSKDELYSVDWLDADKCLIPLIEEKGFKKEN